MHGQRRSWPGAGSPRRPGHVGGVTAAHRRAAAGSYGRGSSAGRAGRHCVSLGLELVADRCSLRGWMVGRARPCGRFWPPSCARPRTGLAAARGIQNTSRQGRYHNAQYRRLAEELGLAVEQSGGFGWSGTTVPDATAAVYAGELGRAGRRAGGLAAAGEPRAAATTGWPRGVRATAHSGRRARAQCGPDHLRDLWRHLHRLRSAGGQADRCHIYRDLAL